MLYHVISLFCQDSNHSKSLGSIRWFNWMIFRLGGLIWLALGDIFGALQVDGCLSLEAQREQRQGATEERCFKKIRWAKNRSILWHQLIWKIYHSLQGFIHPRWCRISSINSILAQSEKNHTVSKKTLPIAVSPANSSTHDIDDGRMMSFLRFRMVGNFCCQKTCLGFCCSRMRYFGSWWTAVRSVEAQCNWGAKLFGGTKKKLGKRFGGTL